MEHVTRKFKPLCLWPGHRGNVLSAPQLHRLHQLIVMKMVDAALRFDTTPPVGYCTGGVTTLLLVNIYYHRPVSCLCFHFKSSVSSS
uniref:Uncharacterized protein n=1 Tax=Alectorobius mimon TaxID=360319 RepID=A0A147B7T5_9ACAR